MRTFFVCAAIASSVLPATARAQTVRLTEAEVLARLGNDSPRVLAARAAIDVARADVLAAARWPNPRVTFNREAVVGVTEHQLMVGQPLPVTGWRGLERSAATARVEAVSSRAEERIRRVRADLRLAFTDLWAAQERERELARHRDRLDELARILARREEEGEAAGFDRLRVEREVVDAEASRAIAGTQLARARAVVASFLSLPAAAAAALEAVRPAPPTAMLPTVDELMARAETARGDLVAFARELEAARVAGQAARRRAIPEPEVVAGIKTSNALGGDAGTIVAVHATVPLFDRAQPERAAAAAKARQARAEAQALRQTIHAQIAAWRAAVIERRTAAGRHRAALDAATGQIERIAQVRYEAGEQGILELLDALRTVSASRVRQIELDAAVREAEIELEFASGWEIP